MLYVGTGLVHNCLQPCVGVKHVGALHTTLHRIRLRKNRVDFMHLNQLIDNCGCTVTEGKSDCPRCTRDHGQVVLIYLEDHLCGDICIGINQPLPKSEDLMTPLEARPMDDHVNRGDILSLLQCIPCASLCCWQNLESEGGA